MRPLGILLGVFALVSGCDSHPRQLEVRDPVNLPSIWEDVYEAVRTCPMPAETSCLERRPIRSWGKATYAPPPTSGYCPVRVRVVEAGVIAEAMTTVDFFDPVPHLACVPDHYAVGTRRALKVDDGYLVAYAGPFDGEVFWTSDDGFERRFITRARLAGFVRAPSGTILALGIGQARLGKGGVIALEPGERGVYVPRLVATLPLEPSAVVSADDGKLLTFAQGFIVRIDEFGKVENLHYVGHDIGKVSSLVASDAGDIYLGVDCGVLRLVRAPQGFREEWWSAGSGASGEWPSCPAAPVTDDTIIHVTVRPIY